MSFCLNVLLSYCPSVLFPNFLLYKCPIVYPFFKIPFVQNTLLSKYLFSKYPFVQIPFSPNTFLVQIPFFPNTFLTKYLFVKITLFYKIPFCPNTLFSKYPFVQIPFCLNTFFLQIPFCPNVLFPNTLLSKYPFVQMSFCQKWTSTTLGNGEQDKCACVIAPGRVPDIVCGFLVAQSDENPAGQHGILRRKRAFITTYTKFNKKKMSFFFSLLQLQSVLFFRRDIVFFS